MATSKMPTYKPIEALIRLIRNNGAHNTAVALAYVSDPASFAALSEAQRRQVHNGACALLGAEETAKSEELLALAAQAETAGRNPRFSWVHQNYQPYAEPGKARRPSLAVQFKRAVDAGMIVPPADFVEVAQAATFSAKNATGVILAAPRRGGYILAVKADAETAKAERKDAPKAGKVSTPQEVASWL